MTPIAKILIVDDEVAQMRALCETLELNGYHTTGFASARAALAALQGNEYDVVLTDLKMPEMDGIEFLDTARKIDPNLVGVVMTGHGTVDTAVDAMKAGSIDYLLKPFKLAAISAALTRALAVRRLRVENLELKETVSIYDLSMSLASVLDSHVVPARVVDAAMQLPYAAGACVLLAVSSGRELQAVECRGDFSTSIQSARIPIDASLSEWVARCREEMSAPSWQAGTRSIEHPLRHLIKSLAVPMFAGGSLIGVLCYLSAQQQRSVKAGQIKALTLLANTAATALDAALLVEEMEERVAHRTAELKAANDELDAFSHSISHDLRAPLRAIEGYCDMLLDEHGTHLPAEALRLFSNVHGNARRMSGLIQDLLAFSRYTREPMKLERVDMHALATRVWSEVIALASQTADITIHPLPVCNGDASLLHQVWINLLSNALKYSQYRETPRIEVGLLDDREHPDDFVFFVRDNGAGFDMKHAERLFGVFQRLHDASQFEGTGVGLSIVRRIILRHGGKIWAESRPEKGATFCFSLPKSQPSN